MTEEQVLAIPRKTAAQILVAVEGGRGYEDRVTLAVESYLNIEWWRGFYAGKHGNFECTASKSNMGHHTPADCAWPECGCDPAASKVIEVLEERGVLDWDDPRTPEFGVGT